MRITKIIGESFYALRSNPKVFIPFFVSGLFNALALYLVYVFPQRPFVYLFGPPVKVFLGEIFLHYPFNLHVIPKLYYYANSFFSATVGVLMTAVAIGMLKDAYCHKKPLIKPNLIYALKRYGAIFLVWFVVFMIIFIFSKFMRSFRIEGMAVKVMPYIVYLGIIFIQLIFIFVLPVLVIKNQSVIRSFFMGITFLKKAFLPALFILGLASLIYLPVFILKQNLPFLTNVFAPEIIVVVFAVGVFVSFIIDVLVTTATTIIFLKKGG